MRYVRIFLATLLSLLIADGLWDPCSIAFTGPLWGP